jgi:hypothetical protein
MRRLRFQRDSIRQWPAARPANHPVVRGVGHLEAEDELYKGVWHSPRIRVLMESATPANDAPVVYLGPYPKWKVLYIQFGHGSHVLSPRLPHAEAQRDPVGRGAGEIERKRRR